jgi:predicted metal-dependent hydrolase
VFEDAWKNAPEDERELWRGLAQIAVGITHAARGNRSGAVSLLGRGAERVAPYDGVYGVDVAAVQAWAAAAVRAVEAACPIDLPPPPV